MVSDYGTLHTTYISMCTGRKRERGGERERERERERETYMRIYMRLWTHLYSKGCMAEGWAISISIERPPRTAGSCWLRDEYNEEISSEKGMRLRWIRMRGFYVHLSFTFSSTSSFSSITSQHLERARALRVSSCVSPRSHLRQYKQERPLYADYCRS